MTLDDNKHFLALSGGVGGAKLALGLSHVLSGDALTVAVNIADDFEHMGLHISPDLDTVMYTLANVSNKQQGWGVANESWQAMSMLESLGGETWFQLGDSDIATHIVRSHALRQGLPLSQITDNMCQKLGLKAKILPMSDDVVQTIVQTDRGQLSFQQYFVAQRCEPVLNSIEFQGIKQAKVQPQLQSLLDGRELAGVIICPSNPFVSVAPMLQLPNLRQSLIDNAAPVVAVSPIVAGMALKGPAAKMMKELKMPITALAVAQYYCEMHSKVIDGFVIDESDAKQAHAIEQLGIKVLVVPTIMSSLDDKIALAQQVVVFCHQLQREASLCGS
jgi:LPPG:FO 2-phospho-L-lactate transferase